MYAVLSTLLAVLALAAQPVREAPTDAPSAGAMTAADEPGERLAVSGVVVDAAGRPIAGASLYVYQTDREGYYGVKPASDNRNPRLKVYLRSAKDGTWSFSTVRPGSYPGSRVPGHIHFEVSASGHPRRVFEIVFEGDPLVTDAMRSNAAFSVRPVVDGRVTERIQLR
jgi:protocatechuate 3,4-dioxygenase beta subunit